MVATSMPLYEYECRKGHRFETIQKVNDKPIKRCEVCSTKAKRSISQLKSFKKDKF